MFLSIMLPNFSAFVSGGMHTTILMDDHVDELHQLNNRKFFSQRKSFQLQNTIARW